MSTPSPRASGALLIALVLGVLGDLLLRTGPWSVNLVLWMVTALALPPLFLFRQGAEAPGGRRYWLISAGCVLAALMMTLRGSPEVWAFNLIALFTGLAILLFQAGGGDLAKATPEQAVALCLRAAVTTGFGAIGLVLGDVDWTAGGSAARRVLLGLLLAFPVVVVLGALLAGADPAFAAIVGVFDLSAAVIHFLVFGWFAWITAGYLRGLLIRPAAPGAGIPELPRLGSLEVKTVLITVLLLFLLFVGVQVRALFGGAEFVTAVSGLTYAEYARRGFFQLVAVGGVTLALVLLVDWIRRGAAEERGLAWGILGLLGLILASAVERMALYVSFYGLSATRLYATMAIAWIAVAAAWLGVTVLRGQRGRFAVGALVTAAIWLAAVDLVNPEAVVVRVNVGRAIAGERFDPGYLSDLSADAVPALVEALPGLSSGDRCTLLSGLLARKWGGAGGSDWRTWNLARARAVRLVAGLPPSTCPVEPSHPSTRLQGQGG